MNKKFISSVHHAVYDPFFRPNCCSRGELRMRILKFLQSKRNFNKGCLGVCSSVWSSNRVGLCSGNSHHPNKFGQNLIKFSNISTVEKSRKNYLNVNYSSPQLKWIKPFSQIAEVMSVEDVLSKCTVQLKEEEISEASLQAEYIVAHAVGLNRIDLNTTLNKPISVEELASIQKMMECRLARMPLQYILGDWDFHSIKLKVRPPVFIPRQETEELVNLALALLKEEEHPIALDIGCGSGAISLALLHNLHQLRCVAVDQSKYATSLTSENARELNLEDRLQVVQGKLTDESWPVVIPREKFNLIVSNPPYVLRKDLIDLQSEISLYEDLRALDGGKDGLDMIKRILLHGHHYLKDHGHVLMEIDPCHRYLLPLWLDKNKTSFYVSQFYSDISGVQRYVKLTKKTR